MYTRKRIGFGQSARSQSDTDLRVLILLKNRFHTAHPLSIFSPSTCKENQMLTENLCPVRLCKGQDRIGLHIHLQWDQKT